MLIVIKRKGWVMAHPFIVRFRCFVRLNIALEDRMRYNIYSRIDFRLFKPAAVLQAVFYKGENYALAKHNV